MAALGLEDTEFLIVCTGRYHWLVDPLVRMYERYFNVPLTFLSDRPVPGYKALEAFPRDMQIYREPCGNLVKAALQQVDKPIVYLGYMDLLPIVPVNLEFVYMLQQLMTSAPIARGNLWAEADQTVKDCENVILDWGSFKVVRLDARHGLIGATSLLPALWRRDFLIEFYEDGWTFDRCELAADKFFAQNRWYSVALLPGQFTSCHLCYTSDPALVRLSTLPDPEDRAYVAQFVPEGSKIE